MGPKVQAWLQHRAPTIPDPVSEVMYVSYDGTGVPTTKSETRNRKGKQPDGTSKSRDRMLYATFQKAGYFVGSGVVEAGCKTVIGKQTKQSGMFWHVPGAENVLATRCAVLGRLFAPYWASLNAA